MSDLLRRLGAIDIYLLDQLMRGRIAPGMRIADVGCGAGRNLAWFLAEGYEVLASDPAPERIRAVRALSAAHGRELAPDALRVEAAEDTTFAPGSADVVIMNAVLHFARDHAHFRAMLDGALRPLAPGGIFFARLTSSIGLDGARALGGGRFLQPDGDERYLVDEAQLLAETQRVGAVLLDPLKTTNVQGARCMTTWVMRVA